MQQRLPDRLLERRAAAQIQRQREGGAGAVEVFLQLYDGLLQQRVVVAFGPSGPGRLVFLVIEPQAGQPLVGGGEHKRPERAADMGLADVSGKFHGVILGSVERVRVRTGVAVVAGPGAAGRRLQARNTA